jgi:hypothetical protein
VSAVPVALQCKQQGAEVRRRQLAAQRYHWRSKCEMNKTVRTHLALAERIHFPVNGAHASALVTRHHLFPPSILWQATLANLSSVICVLMGLDPSTMTRSSICCLGCDAAVLPPAGAVCIGAGADGLVIEGIASDRGLFVSKFERKLRGALRESCVP